MKKVSFNKFLDMYNHDEINTFSWYLNGDNKSTFALVRIDSFDKLSGKLELDLSKTKTLNDFKIWICNEIDNGKLMCNNCYQSPESEYKMHFYVKKKMRFISGKTLISDHGEPFREVPAEEVDNTYFKRFVNS